MRKVLLCIMDGVGISDNIDKNAFYNARTPNYDYLINNYPHSKLIASGEEVGLPKGQMGNSEVGHTNIGAGRIVYQSLEYINNQIKTKEFFSNEKLLDVINYTKENGSNLHIMGLLSDGGIHSSINHLFALLDMCKDNDINNVYLHMFTDGRDTMPDDGIKYINMLEDKINRLGIGKIVSLSGRYYAMDRDNRYDRVKLAYDAIVNAKGREYKSAKECWEEQQNKGITDEFIVPSVIDGGKILKENDGIIVFNFRPDRIRELPSAITNSNFNGFDREYIPNIKMVTMMGVSDEVICDNAFELPLVINPLGEYISKLGLTQLRIAETEKYAHVTYFFDGGLEMDLKGCKRILIPSSHVATYDLKPEMSAYEITDKLIEEINNNEPDLIVLNYANGDMVGHTGNYDAAVKGVEAVDSCIGRLMKNNVLDKYTLFLTADHGNCELMEIDGKMNTKHTTNLVPLIVTDKNINLKDGKLGDIAVSILNIMNIDKPKEMTGNNLIERK